MINVSKYAKAIHATGAALFDTRIYLHNRRKIACVCPLSCPPYSSCAATRVRVQVPILYSVLHHRFSILFGICREICSDAIWVLFGPFPRVLAIACLAIREDAKRPRFVFVERRDRQCFVAARTTFEVDSHAESITTSEKYNAMAIAGWAVIRVTAAHIKSGQALAWIERLVR